MFEIQDRAAQKKINLRYFDDESVGIALDETVTEEDLKDLFYIFGVKNSVEEVRFLKNYSDSLYMLF